ncbi:MAG: complex I subunit 5 family protein [Brotaphodocola sp.]
MSSAMEWMIPGFCGMGMHFRLDGFRLIYVGIAVFMWAVSGVFSKEYMHHYEKKSRYYLFFWATFLATVGVFLSADLYTTFIFFEIMSFTSYVWVAFDERRESLKAAETYLAVAVIGGMVMLMGLFMLQNLFGTLEMEALSDQASALLRISQENGILTSPAVRLYVAGGLLLFGFGAKAGCFPLHIWLPKAHPEAPAPASALLSGILTKAGVFGIIIVSCGMFGSDANWGHLIAFLGLITMFTGAFLALFSVNLKRTLACSSISQIGFILTGIGMACLLKSVGEDNSLAVRGAFLHMVNHSLLKLVLFLCAGAVYMNLHQLNLNDIRGFGRNKSMLKFCFLMGTLGITGVPGWNGYISKTLIHESIVEYIQVLGHSVFWKSAEWVFLFSGGMTVAYMLKLFIAVFVEEHPTRQKEFDRMVNSYMRPSSSVGMGTAAAVLPVLGMTAHLTMDRIADMGQQFFHGGHHVHVVHYFAWENLKGGLISIAIGLVLYGFVIRGMMMEPIGQQEKGKGEKRYADRWPSWLDLENLVYRPVLQVAFPGIFGAVFGFIDKYFITVLVKVFMAVSAVVCRCMDHSADGFIRLARATTHRQLAEPYQNHDANYMGQVMGRTVDKWRKLKNLLLISGKKKQAGEFKSSIPAFVKKEAECKRLIKLVGESFSYGLMLVCIGLCLTMGYLLIVFFER